MASRRPGKKNSSRARATCLPEASPRLVDILSRSATYLRRHGVPQPQLDAERLIGHALGLPRLQLYLQHDRPLDPEELATVRALLQRRGKREPIAWLLGMTGFHAVDLEIRPGVLVPRPDTETLVDAALSWMSETPDPVYVADVCCGSGCVGLALAAARPGLRVYATDLAPEAIETTRANIARLGLKERVAVLSGDLLRPIPDGRPIDWVVSNPPYIPSAEIDGLEPEVSRWEPRLALDGGPTGLGVVHRLIAAAAVRVRIGVLLEVGKGQAPRTVEWLKQAGFTVTDTWEDLGGVQRVVGGRRT